LIRSSILAVIVVQSSGRSQLKSCIPKVTPGASIDLIILHLDYVLLMVAISTVDG